MSQEKETVFKTKYGLLIYFTDQTETAPVNTEQSVAEQNKIDKNKSDKKLNFLNLLTERKIPYYILNQQNFSQEISQLIQKIPSIIQKKSDPDHDKMNIEQKDKSSQTKNYVDGTDTANKKIQKKSEEFKDLENIIFFSGFTREQLEEFLKLIRSDKFPRFPLKAAATKHNYRFTFHQLIKELTQDRIVISHIINLREKINFIEKMIIENKILTSDEKKMLEIEIEKAEKLLVDVETDFDLEKFKNQIHKFNKLLTEIKKKD